MGDTSPGPHEVFIFMIFTFMGCIFMLFLYLLLSHHCLDSMSERLGRIISNSVKHRELIDHAHE